MTNNEKQVFDTKLKPSQDENALKEAAEYLKEGEIVAIPTETVYGLAANALNEEAVAKIYEAKGRPSDNPLIVHVCNMKMWGELVEEITEDAKLLADKFWPGPLTIILPKSSKVPMKTTGGLDTVAVRMPSHKDTLRLIELSNLPIAAPSANLSGLPSPTTAEHCVRDLNGKIPLILDGGICNVGIESTVVTLAGEKPVLLRPGKITAEELSEALGKEVSIASAVINPLKEGEKVSSPGMKYKHYSPKAKVILVKGSLEGFKKKFEDSPEGTYALVFSGEEKNFTKNTIPYGFEHDPDSQGRTIFALLREMDDLGAKLVLVRCPHEDEALGVYNRLIRAAAFKIEEV